jgi:adenylosuccinate lyase
MSFSVPNVLAERYASDALRAIWSPEGRIRIERDLWIAVLRAQRDLGLDIPSEAIDAYVAVRDSIDLGDIAERERVTLHDVKARIESFNAVAGHEQIHKGMTSRDLTENVEQLQFHRSLQVILEKAVAVLHLFAERADQWRGVCLTGRTHNVAAQPTTMGKRLAMFGEELLAAIEALQTYVDTYRIRGLKGAVGTQLDLLTLFAGDAAKVADLEDRVLAHLGVGQVWRNTGQVYPRSQDFAGVSALLRLASAPSSFAKTLRLMAGHELASEGFAPGQTGSSAMPHKMNSRSCERINGFHAILGGHVQMTTALAGDQWNEGDVSCSVVRRVVLPDSCFAADGLLETTHVVLSRMNIAETVIDTENRRYLPFLATTTLLMQAVQTGTGRETAHASIKKHALATIEDLRSGAIRDNDLGERLARDPNFPLDAEAIERTLSEAAVLTGSAADQVTAFRDAAQPWFDRYPKARDYEVASIL